MSKKTKIENQKQSGDQLESNLCFQNNINISTKCKKKNKKNRH